MLIFKVFWYNKLNLFTLIFRDDIDAKVLKEMFNLRIFAVLQ